MSARRAFCFDTNSLVYAVDRGSGDRHEHRLAFWGAMIWAAVRRLGCGPIQFVDRPQHRLKSGPGIGPQIWEVPTTTLLDRNRH